MNILRKNPIDLLPYIVAAVLLFQAPLQVLLFDNIHLYILAVSDVILFVKYMATKPVIKNKRIAMFIGVICLWICISGFMLPSILIPLIGMLDYLLMFVFWAFFYNLYAEKFKVTDYVGFLVYLGFVLAIGGIYQRFVDPSLFGIMRQLQPYYDEKTIELAEVFRIASFMHSGQTFSMYIGFCTASLLELWTEIPIGEIGRWVFLAAFLLSGLLAGGKIYVFIVGITMVLVIWKKIKKGAFRCRLDILAVRGYVFCAALLCAFLMIIVSDKLLDELHAVMSSLSRIFLVFIDTNEALRQEAGRFSIIFKLFQDGWKSIIFGHGLGTSSYSAYNVLHNRIEFQRFTTESYAMSYWYEMGILGFVAFLFVFMGGLVKCYKANEKLFITMLCMFLTMFFSPAFYQTAFFPILGIFVFFCYI